MKMEHDIKQSTQMMNMGFTTRKQHTFLPLPPQPAPPGRDDGRGSHRGVGAARRTRQLES